MITEIEEISLNALPALQTVLYDGWVLRFSNGYTRRANSVQPLYPPKQPLAEKIAYCEDLYRRHNLPVVFKMTPAAQPAALDAELDRRGYVCEADTIVESCALVDVVGGIADGIEISDNWSDIWYAEFARMNRLDASRREIPEKMLKLIVPQTAFTLLREGGQVCACGLGVLQGKHIGLFDIVVDETARRRGHGKRLVSSLLAWGKARGAESAYLQVMGNNLPARKLYEQLGFIEQYNYWYRVHI